jgi:hypothetical protein
MTGGQFSVDVDKMQKLLEKLGHVEQTMTVASKKLKNVGPNGLGSEGLDHACDEFQSQWDDGITRIAKASAAIHDKLQQTITTYDDNEKNTAKSLSA